MSVGRTGPGPSLPLQYRIATLSAFSSGVARAIFTTLLLLTVAFERATSAAAIEITVHLHSDHRRHEARIRDAAGEAITQYIEWFGPAPFESLTVETAPPTVLASADRAGRISLRPHWLQPERSLLLEAEIARRRAPMVGNRDHHAGAVVRRHRQERESRIVEQIYDRRHHAAYSTYGRVTSEAWCVGDQAVRLDRRPRHRPLEVPPARGGRTSVRSAPDQGCSRGQDRSGLLTLERYIGWPRCSGLSLSVERYRGRSMSADDFARTIGDAADRDLSWFFDRC